MINALKRNFGYKLLSVAVAILLYSYADAQRNPPATRDVDVEIKPINLPDDLVIRKLPENISVSARGPQVGVDGFRAQTDKATIDLGSAKPGRLRLPIKYRTEGLPVDVIGPEQADVVLEKKARREWYVDVIFDNTPPPGFQFAEPVANPRKVSVEGLAENVNRVWRVVASLEDTEGSGAVNRAVELVAQDKKQENVTSVEIVPSRVQVTLGLKKTPASKSLLLSAQISGAPAPGFALVSYTFLPSNVTVSGPQEVLSARSSLEVPLDIEGLRASQTRTVTLSAPLGLSLQQREPVRVRLEVRAITPSLPPSTPEATRPTPRPAPSVTPAAVPMENSNNNTPLRETP